MDYYDEFDSLYDDENEYNAENTFDYYYEGYLQGVRDMTPLEENAIGRKETSDNTDNKPFVSVEHKIALTIPEAAEYSNIGQIGLQDF